MRDKEHANISHPQMVTECEDKKHRDNNDNEAETNMVTLDKETEK